MSLHFQSYFVVTDAQSFSPLFVYISIDQHQQITMPLKRIPTSTAHSGPSPTPLDDHPEPSPSIGEPTVAEYNDLATAHREALHRINELEANADSSHTSLGPQEQSRKPRVEPPPETLLANNSSVCLRHRLVPLSSSLRSLMVPYAYASIIVLSTV